MLPAHHIEQAGDIVAVLGLLILEGLFQIIVAVRQAEPALGGVQRIAARVLGVLADIDGKQAAAECVFRPPHQGGNVGAGLRGTNLRQVAGDRGGVALRDPRLIHERIVKSTDFAGIGVGGRMRIGRVFDDGAHLFLGLVGERVEHAETGFVGGDYGTGNPGTVGIVEEAVARTGVLVDPGRVEAPMPIDGTRRPHCRGGFFGRRKGSAARDGYERRQGYRDRLVLHPRPFRLPHRLHLFK